MIVMHKGNAVCPIPEKEVVEVDNAAWLNADIHHAEKCRKKKKSKPAACIGGEGSERRECKQQS